MDVTQREFYESHGNTVQLIPILYEDALYMRNEPQRAHRHIRVGKASRREASPRVVADRRVGHKERNK
ncbi:hypothetical protein [Nostoc sp.]|uniref:hypothetical protein n=1 Tax=Nostoc sp. TaxID=1180 RepID=UPI002FF4B137